MPMLTPTPTRFINQITRHIERTIGPSPMVFHEIISTDIHLDLHVVPPQPEGPSPDHPYGRDFYTLVTSGMSTRPMNPPAAGASDIPRYAELMITLPTDWPGLRPDGTFVQEYMHDEANWWPIRWLKMLARMPYEQETCMAAGQMIPNGERAAPYAAGTHFGCMLLLPSRLHPRSSRLVVHDDMAIDFFALWPLYPQEMHYKCQRGLEALRSCLTGSGITDLIDIHRQNAAPTR